MRGVAASLGRTLKERMESRVWGGRNLFPSLEAVVEKYSAIEGQVRSSQEQEGEDLSSLERYLLCSYTDGHYTGPMFATPNLLVPTMKQ